MCEANVYMLEENGENTLILESVDKIIPQKDGIFLEDIFGQRKIVKARIIEMVLVEHKIVLQRVE